MTLICTVINQLGVIQASDSNLSSADAHVGEGQKVFSIPYGPGALALAGTYAVGGRDMDHWMQEAIDDYGATDHPTLAGLAEVLRARLTDELTSDERGAGCMLHIAGYEGEGKEVHPAFYFVRNIAGISASGDYDGFGREFQCTEDFWTRDLPNARDRGVQLARFEFRYFNGTPPGRIAFTGAGDLLRQFYAAVWDVPGWQFRPPATLDEVAAFVDLEIRAIGVLYKSSDYDAPFIGGGTQISAIPPPLGCAEWG